MLLRMGPYLASEVATESIIAAAYVIGGLVLAEMRPTSTKGASVFLGK